jgi:hypothetical protein
VLAVQKWVAQCYRADTGLSAQWCIVAGMAFSRGWVEQRWGMIPMRVRVMTRSCGVRALNAWAREQERERRARGPSSEADLARGVVPVCRGGQCCDRLVCAFFRLVG